jgi:hypothetical protein
MLSPTQLSAREGCITASKTFYVYILRDPRPGKGMQRIYVGKGNGWRARRHWCEAKDHSNPLLHNVFAKIRKAGLKPHIEIVRHFEVEADAFHLEIELIAEYGRRDLKTGTLCNLTDGGEGAVGCLGAAERARAQMRQQHADPAFAKARDERSRLQMRRLNADPKFRKANAERLRQMHTDPEFRKASDERTRQQNANPEFKKANAERGSLRFRQLHADPEFAKAHAEHSRSRMSKLNADPEFRKARAEGSRQRNADPVFAAANAERMRLRNADPAFQARRAAGTAARWATQRGAITPTLARSDLKQFQGENQC